MGQNGDVRPPRSHTERTGGSRVRRDGLHPDLGAKAAVIQPVAQLQSCAAAPDREIHDRQTKAAAWRIRVSMPPTEKALRHMRQFLLGDFRTLVLDEKRHATGETPTDGAAVRGMQEGIFMQIS